MKKIWITFLLTIVYTTVSAQSLKPFEVTEDWISKIKAIAPSKMDVKGKKQKKILIFSLHTGFNHWVIPHTEAVIKVIAEKSGAYTVTTSKDIAIFSKKNLKKYDAIVLNNNCSIGDHRNLFLDKLKEDKSLSEAEVKLKAKELEENLLQYVAQGGGLMLMHGAIVMQNKSAEFSKMVGGSFDYHPKQQEINVKLVDANHPMVKGFKGQGFSHIDEPYFFNNAYFDYNFKPLLYINTTELEGLKKEVKDTIKYISWIKTYGKGRVFYSSPSHNAQSFENPELLTYFLNGIHYTSGNLNCDDSPMNH